MTIAITGADGFTGRYVTAELDRREISWCSLSADLRDEAAVHAEVAASPKFSALIHLAAIAFAGGGDWRAFTMSTKLALSIYWTASLVTTLVLDVSLQAVHKFMVARLLASLMNLMHVILPITTALANMRWSWAQGTGLIK